MSPLGSYREYLVSSCWALEKQLGPKSLTYSMDYPLTDSIEDSIIERWKREEAECVSRK